MKTDNNNPFMYVEQNDGTEKSLPLLLKTYQFSIFVYTKEGEDNKLRNKETEKSALDMK